MPFARVHTMENAVLERDPKAYRHHAGDEANHDEADHHANDDIYRLDIVRTCTHKKIASSAKHSVKTAK